MKNALRNKNRTFGVEMELICAQGRAAVARALTDAGIPCQYEGYNHATRRNWKLVFDASVGYGDGAMELVSPPLKGIEGLEQIEKVCEVLRSMNCKVNRNCGMHVHHDASKFKFENLKRLVHLYGKVERQFDSMMPESRRARNNHYCESVVGSEAEWADGQVYNTYRYEGPFGRYAKINVNAFHQHGTVEFRHHSGTVEARKIIAWVIITQRMVERCKGVRKAPEKEISNWTDTLQAIGIPAVAYDKMDPADAELKKYTIERREHFRRQASRTRRMVRR